MPLIGCFLKLSDIKSPARMKLMRDLREDGSSTSWQCNRRREHDLAMLFFTGEIIAAYRQ